MKKFITAALMLALATAPSQAINTACAFHAQAPDAHVVIPGDTLWEIAEKFLKNPWCWPDVWEQNKNLVSNPHKIYPGQTIYFDRIHGRLTLSETIKNAASQTEKRSPRMRAESLQGEAIPLVAPDILALVNTLPVLDTDQINGAARILAFTDGRTMGMKNDAVFVTGALNGQQNFQIIRPDREGIKDPDTGRILAHMGKLVGTARAVRASSDPRQAHLFAATDSSAELLVGDLLMPARAVAPISAWPFLHASVPVSARIVKIFREGLWAAPYDMVAINRGSRDGLDPGSTLSVIRQAKIMLDKKHNPDKLDAPMQTIATLLIIRATDSLALALVMRSIDGLHIGDLVESAREHGQ